MKTRISCLLVFSFIATSIFPFHAYAYPGSLSSRVDYLLSQAQRERKEHRLACAKNAALGTLAIASMSTGVGLIWAIPELFGNYKRLGMADRDRREASSCSLGISGLKEAKALLAAVDQAFYHLDDMGEEGPTVRGLLSKKQVQMIKKRSYMGESFSATVIRLHDADVAGSDELGSYSQETTERALLLIEDAFKSRVQPSFDILSDDF